jgi:lysosome membrane protein 2
MNGKTWGIIAIVAGVIFLGLGAGLGWGAFPSIVKGQVEDNIDLTNPETDGYINFVTPPVPLYMKFTFFNVENPAQLVTGAEKGRFKDMGPYAYREVKEKRNLTFTGDKLAFEQYRHFEFDKSQSCAGCEKTDRVRILNMPLIGGVAAAMKEPSSLQDFVMGELAGAIDSTANSPDLFMEDSVDNILFGGVNNDLVKLLLENNALKKQLPPAIQDNGFAIFNTKNATTHNECYEVDVTVERHTEINLWGADSDSLGPDLKDARTCPSEIGGVEFSCKSTKTFPFWWPYPDIDGNDRKTENVTNTCNLLKGTNGEQFPPFLDDRRDDPLWIFSTDLCRSMSLTYLEERDIEGIRTLRYTLPRDAGNVNQTDNVCFCKELAEKWNDVCIKRTEDPKVLDIKECGITSCHDGLQDVTDCMMSPVRMSSPHFYLAEAQLNNFDDASGLAPEVALHQTILDIEPTTGMTLSAHKRIQINMPIVATGRGEIVFLQDITHVPAFPILWLDEGADIDQANIDKIKSMVTTPLLLLDIAKYGMIGLGAALLVLGSLVMCLKR